LKTNRSRQFAIDAVLETDRMLLRKMTVEDADALALVLSDPETMRHYPNPLDRTGVLQWIDHNQCRYAEFGCGLYAAVLKDTGEVIGDCGLNWQQVDGASELEVGYHFRRSLWGRGLATEAAGACITYGFARWNPPRIIALIRPENRQSCRVAEKLGMSIERVTAWRELPHYVYELANPTMSAGLA
jgi:[ribosomal protein S5]-alanine N-acetyltransferase